MDKYFDIVKEKNERIVYVPYNIIIQLKPLKAKLLGIDVGNIKAKLIYKDKVILKDKFKSLIKYFDKIDLDTGLNQRYPKNESLLYPNDWVEMFKFITLLMKPTLENQKSRKTGFLTFRCVDESSFEFFLEHDFFCSLEESLHSMEKLFDSEIPAWTDSEKKVLEAIHHKLNKLSEEMDLQ